MAEEYAKQKTFVQIDAEGAKEQKNNIIVEIPSRLMVNGQDWLTFRCSPMHLEELGAGFLFNLGFIKNKNEIEILQICENNGVDIWLTKSVKKPLNFERASGSTGGSAPQPFLLYPTKRENDPAMFSSKQIDQLIESFLKAQTYRSEIRGLHASALSDGNSILCLMADIGRHNTLDKLAGDWLYREQRPQTSIILTTGRISLEMLQKCLLMNTEMIISLSTPTTQAIEEAQKENITLIGYAKPGKFNIYSFADRINFL